MSKRHCFKSITLSNKIAIEFVFFILIIALLPGCASKKGGKEDPVFEKWKIKAEQSRGFSPSARKLAVDLPEKAIIEEKAKQEGEAPEPEKPLPTKKISMKMHNVELAVLLRSMALVADQNIMINQNVKGEAKINIKNAPWDQVFRGILSTHGLIYAWEGDIIRIITLEDINHDLEILNADLKKVSARKEYDLGIESLTAMAVMLEPLVTKVIHIKYADPKTLRENLWQFLQSGRVGSTQLGMYGETRVEGTTAAKGMVSGPIRGAILVDPHTNSLMIQAIRSDIERLLPLIDELDRPTRQILIEANIVETNKKTARDLGIQWGGLYKGTMGGDKSEWVTAGSNSTGVLKNSFFDEETGNVVGINPTSGLAVNFPAGGMTLGYVTERLGKHVLNVQLSALETEGRLNILSSPSITTLDNQKAVIESGKVVPFKVTSGENVGDIEYKNVVIRLEVTPYVVDEKTLKLKIVTNKDDLDWANAVDGNPAISTKKAETSVVLFDGQTTVIAGLSKENINDSESGIPWLKDIPILGYLFKGTSKSNTMEDVLIFITPHILKEKVMDEE
ncbi:MAG: type IV pilus secretin PilQ [Proteobacteria bacterium]|nr:type IV pilus secretin PilQ [Pseudomonadota bacterium]